VELLAIVVYLSSIYFIGFASGFAARAIMSQRQRNKARKARDAAQVDWPSAHRSVSAQPSEKHSSVLTRFAPHTLALTSNGRST
jgi:hypothetical protein